MSMTLATLALLAVVGPAASPAQQRCADVESAKVALNAKPAGRQPMAARSQDVQAPRSQDVQAPRNQDIQAPRNQDVQAPRGQAAQLAKEAEAACNSGNTALASEKARAAMSLIER
jgi:hypothetical protein